MATFIPEIQKKKADGTYNISIRITHNRQLRRLPTQIYVTDSDLTRGGKIKSQKIVDRCDELIKKFRGACNDIGDEIKRLPIDVFVERLNSHIGDENAFRLDLFEYTRKKMAEMLPGTAGLYGNMLSALRRYLNCEQLDISDIKADFLKGFQKFLETEPSKRGDNRKIGQDKGKKGGRAVSLYLSNLRAIHNKAKEEYNDEDRGIIKIPYSPFNYFKIPSQPKTRKRALSIEAIQAIIDLPYQLDIVGGRWNCFNLAKDCFLLSFALAGMNSADMFIATKAKKDIITYNRQKTMTRRDDKAEMKIRIEDCIKPLIDKYKDVLGDNLFRFYWHYSTANNLNTAINRGLKQIGNTIGVDDLEFYAARHSWATIGSSAKVGIDKYTIHEGLNHAPEKEMKVTDIYIDKDWSNIWGANKKILSLFNWPQGC